MTLAAVADPFSRWIMLPNSLAASFISFDRTNLIPADKYTALSFFLGMGFDSTPSSYTRQPHANWSLLKGTMILSIPAFNPAAVVAAPPPTWFLK